MSAGRRVAGGECFWLRLVSPHPELEFTLYERATSRAQGGKDPAGRTLISLLMDGYSRGSKMATMSSDQLPKPTARKQELPLWKPSAQEVKFTSLCLLLALMCENDWELEGMDTKTGFLNNELEERVYLDIPEGLEIDTPAEATNQHMTCRFIKSIYGLRQSPQAWYGKIKTFFFDHHFHWSECDHHIYIHSLYKLILLLYVEDLVITS